MLKIEGKTFMNIQEAVQWLLENNPLPFQSTANYAGNTEIGLGTIVNPSPAKVRIGSLIFFADSKVSTVTGLTENGFICSNEYNNLVDDIAYVTGITINGNGHLITTLSDGQTIDAGLIKQVVGFSINNAQHLIVSYNDGTVTDLGAIFSGDVNINGNLTAKSIIQSMNGYGLVGRNNLLQNVYLGICQNGNKLTFALSFDITLTERPQYEIIGLANFYIPYDVYPLLVTKNTGGLTDVVNAGTVGAITIPQDDAIPVNYYVQKTIQDGYYQVQFNMRTNKLTTGTTYTIRIEQTYLLSENLAS